MNTFSGKRMFLRLLGEYEPLDLLIIVKKGFQMGHMFPNLTKITLKHDVWALFERFQFMKVRNEHFF